MLQMVYIATPLSISQYYYYTAPGDEGLSIELHPRLQLHFLKAGIEADGFLQMGHWLSDTADTVLDIAFHVLGARYIV